MIVTVTLNPSLDRTLRVESLRRGAVQRALHTDVDPGGKGVNVARALSAHGTRVTTVLPVGGSTGDTLVTLLEEAGVDHVVVPVPQRTRANISLVEPDGTTTKVNEPGTPLSAAEIAAVVAAVSDRVGPGDWVVTAGSLAPTQDPQVYAEIGRAARRAGARWAVDPSGDALAASLAAAPDLAKPNREELSEVLGLSIDTLRDVVTVCRDLVGDSDRSVLCSLGGDGAVLVDRTSARHATGPKVQVQNTVGAGDSLLAGHLHGLVTTGRPEDGLRTGIAWATAAVATPGTGVPAPELVRPDGVRITDATVNQHIQLESA